MGQDDAVEDFGDTPNVMRFWLLNHFEPIPTDVTLPDFVPFEECSRSCINHPESR